jgi:hypothetical protein
MGAKFARTRRNMLLAWKSLWHSVKGTEGSRKRACNRSQHVTAYESSMIAVSFGDKCTSPPGSLPYFSFAKHQALRPAAMAASHWARPQPLYQSAPRNQLCNNDSKHHTQKQLTESTWKTLLKR